jgi:DNA polymerase-3 subunit epsilon
MAITIDGPFVFLDVETTGANWSRNFVIEIGAIRYEHGEVTKVMKTLVRPSEPIPRMITGLTGINDRMVADAPEFAEVADELIELFSDEAILIAHNAPFDYSFIKQEFARLGKPFPVKRIDTVRLSRSLYPEQARHRLSDLIKYHGLSFESRHRAYDDAYALVQFWNKILQEFGDEHIEGLINRQSRAARIPKNLSHLDIEQLPSSFGVYLFKDENDYPLYIGKSINIKKRVKSHFMRDSDEYKEFKISQTVKKIDYIETDGELAALLLESFLVKQYMPLYNIRLRRTKKLIVVSYVFDEYGYKTLKTEALNTSEVHDYSNILSMHTKKSMATMTMDRLIKTFELCPRLCGIEKGKGKCFLRQLGKCRGACEGAESPESYNERVDIAFADRGISEWPYAEPMVFYEKMNTPVKTGFLVDNWIIQKMIRFDPDEGYSEEPYSQAFDLDAYTILKSYRDLQPERIITVPYSQILSESA